MRDAVLSVYFGTVSLPRRAAQRLRLASDRGEGVISTAIVVLIMAGLGLAMWLAFSNIWSDAEGRITEQIEKIGDDGDAG